MIILIIIDFSRAMVAYTMASSAVRRAVRHAEVIGYDTEDPIYLDCDSMLSTAQQVYFADWSDDITDDIDIYFVSHETGNQIQCELASENTVLNGDMLVVEVVASVRLLNPFVNSWIDRLYFNFSGQRTIVKNIELNSDVDEDKDYDGLLDDWEMTHFGNTNAIGTEDPDNDGCNNGCEETRGSDPNNADTDGDGLSDGDEAYVYHTDPLESDSDGDGLSDGLEIAAGSDPFEGDSDGDGLLDGDEINLYNTNPDSNDSDGDGLTDNAEVAGYDINGDGVKDFFPLPNDTDSDDDTLTDDVEVAGYDINGDGVMDYYSNPRESDEDGDGLSDAAERLGFPSADGLITYYSNPRLSDADGDLFNDADEKFYGTDPNNPDTDSDGLMDAEEIIYETDSNNADTDGDGLFDGDEVNSYGTDPRYFDEDRDFDTIPDAWEEIYFAPLAAPEVDPESDPDGDGCNNLCEFENGIEPDNADSDADGINDGDELNGYTVSGYDALFTTDPRNADTDGDTLMDGVEKSGFDIDGITYYTDPTDSDTDGDGLLDGNEINGVQTNYGTMFANPTLLDTDGDTLEDRDEIVINNTNPSMADSDNDGLDDNVELQGLSGYFTDPRLFDTDTDGLSDGEEANGVDIESTLNGVSAVRTYIADPTRADTDTDGVEDGDELNSAVGSASITNPNSTDTDGDGLLDGNEINGLPATNPAELDTDGDGLHDGDELSSNNGYITDPTLTDTDIDGFDDTTEIANGTNPLDPLDPGADLDGDGLQDRWETDYFGSIEAYNGNDDPDSDGCNNECEETSATHPSVADTDSDGLLDGDEINGTSMANAGFAGLTDPLVADTDGDTMSDGVELSQSPPTNPTQVTPYITIGDGNGVGTVMEPVCTGACSELTFVSFTITLHNDYAGRTDPISMNYRTIDVTDTMPPSFNDTYPSATGSTFKSNSPGTVASKNDFRATDDRLSIYTVTFDPIAMGESVPAERTETMTIVVYSDKDDEYGGEVFIVQIENATNAIIIDEYGKMTIFDPVSS